MNRSWWHGRRVLITGHTGFKGAWLAAWLQRLGARVAGFALAAERASVYELARLGEAMESAAGDVRDLGSVERAVAAAEPEVVFHLAAQALVRASYAQPVETYATNVLGTVHVLEAARKARGLRAVVVVTSDKCYENREWVWPYRETDRLGGSDPYANSKACAELVVASYRQAFLGPAGVGVATARAGNVIGGGDVAADRLVPDVVAACRGGRRVRVRNPEAVRPWQHVLDPLHGYLLLAERLCENAASYSEAWNFAPSDERTLTVAEVAQRVIDAWGTGAIERDEGSHAHEAQQLRVDASKARARLGWRPLLDVEEAIRWTAEWYRAAAGGADARRLVDADIDRFEARMNAAVPVLQ